MEYEAEMPVQCIVLLMYMLATSYFKLWTEFAYVSTDADDIDSQVGSSPSGPEQRSRITSRLQVQLCPFQEESRTIRDCTTQEE